MAEIACVDISCITPEDYGRLFDKADACRQSKAEKCLRQEDKYRCVAAGALLGYAVKKQFGEQRFQVAVDSFGKPYLPDYPDFHFNLSHSGRFVVIAYGECPVGVDIQQMRLSQNCVHLARRYYSPQEQEYVFDQMGNCQRNRFFQIWTAKESYLKYLGVGLRRSLNSFSVIDGLPDVKLDSLLLDDYCLTLCSQRGGFKITLLNITDI